MLIELLFACNFSLEANADDEAAKRIEFFENRIRPVLVEHCYECHSSTSKGLKGGLFVDSSKGLRMGGDSGPAITLGDSKASLLMQAIRYESTEMPPKGKLSDSVIADFAQWIDSGATDPRIDESPVEKNSINIEKFRSFWSFVPPQKPTIPVVTQTDWPINPIDHFVLAELEKRGLRPVPAAEKRALIRRATFDLTGLPPTPAEVESFLADTEPTAFEKVVERLLRSPAYGERWGRYWLDVARYSEDQAHTFSVTPNTNGFRYRDWVISAMNSDMPYDLFVKRQIAGDLVATNDEERFEQLPALGYFGLGAQYYKNSDAAKAAADELDDRIDTLTRGFLGLTVSCARCHDHKFDPIPQQDYYSLAGIFQSSKLHTAPLVPQPDVDMYQKHQKQIKELEKEIAQVIASVGPRAREAEVERIAAYMIAVSKTQRLKEPANLGKISEEAGLNAKTLKRWGEFLGKDETRSIPTLAAWYEAVDAIPPEDSKASTSEQWVAPASLVSASNKFQRYASLLLRQRDAKLTADEKQELAQYVDPGNSIFRSAPVTKSEPTVSIDVDITGAKRLFLVVSDGDNGISCDHADWAEPVLVMEGGAELKLTEIKWRETKTSFGEVHVDQNVNGQQIRIGGTTYRFGLGTHATSMISYDLPDGARRFRAIGGLDNSGTDQEGDCGKNARIQFSVYTETPRDFATTQPNLLASLFGEKGLFVVDEAQMEKLLSPELSEQLSDKRESLQQLKKTAPAMYPTAHVIAESKPADMKIFIRGNPANQGEVAPRRFLRILSENEPKSYSEGSGRRELAESIASKDNPLTARVMVNRIWQHHFGTGIVGTPDNFGALGEKPTHPELLDYMTHQFLDSGWSLKTMHREIMLSATYQVSTQQNEDNMNIDADNRYLWRMNRRRLEVEAWRDALLSVSGKLDSHMEGASTNLADPKNSRRTVYAFISRHELNSMLRLFDFPDANITASTRAETTVPQQQLFVLNSPFMIEQAKAFAKRLKMEAGDDIDARVRYAFNLAFSRPVGDVELKLANQYLDGASHDSEKEKNTMDRWERYAQVILGSNEFMYLD
ncbi:MAG: DUF1553 domain-containing protein [Pirellula sp.]